MSQEPTQPLKRHITSQILFQEFCDLCEKIKNATKVKSKEEILQRYISDYRNKEPSDMDKDFFPVLRMLLPQAERERGAYGIKENTLAKMYIRILNLPKQGHEATKLLNYKAQASSVDFGDVAFYVLKSRCNNPGKLTIQDVNDSLDRIANFNAENKPRSVDEELTKFVSNMAASQQKWLIRIILKDLKLGMGHQRILSCYHIDASDYYDSCNSLSKVCSTLHSAGVRLHEIEIEMFSPFRPMLSERLDITKIKSAMKTGEEYFLEMKFDGERFQIHMKDRRFKYFSRNGFDFTSNFGESFDSDGLLTKHLQDALDPAVRSCILDGEMMGWHKTKKVFGSKGMTFDVKKMTATSTYRPCFCSFDILLLNDVVLTNVPLQERLAMLDTLFTDKEGVLIHSQRISTQSWEDVLSALNKAIDDQEEGIILKSKNSLYKPNSRKKGWFKIKPEYTEGAMNELDLLIIGGYYAENKRHGLVNSVLLGVAVPSEDQGGQPAQFHSVGRVMLSLRGEETEELCSKLQPHWKTLDQHQPPAALCWTREKPDLWIEPHHSFILQIKASELVRSSAFKTDFTLRFPRIEKIRFDKPWYGCMTTLEFAELTKDSHNVEKLTARHIGSDELEEDSAVSPRKRARPGAQQVALQFRAADVSRVQECSTLYAGKEVCVMTGDQQNAKAQLEIKVVENGGKIVQNPGPATFCIVAGSVNARVNNIITSGSHNVCTVEWFLGSVAAARVAEGRLRGWGPRDLLAMSRETAQEFALKYDQFGDSFTQPATMDSLKYSMKRVSDIVGRRHLLPAELLELDKELFSEKVSPYSFLRCCHIYIATDFSRLSPSEAAQAQRSLRILKTELNFFGGSCEEELSDDGITHILVSAYFKKENINKIKNEIKFFKFKPVILSLEWLERCIEERKHLKEEDFILVL